jgi:hypothetical protein
MTDIIGYFGLALLLASLPTQLARWCRASVTTLRWIWLATAVLVLLPWQGMSLVYFMRGVLGDPSIATITYLILVYYRLLVQGEYHRPSWKPSLVLVLILGTLYASTTGYLEYDLYSWGYQPQVLLVLAFVLMVLAWHVNRLLAFAWLAGTIAFALGITPSVNFWDALFDPYLFLGSLLVMCSAPFTIST